MARDRQRAKQRKARRAKQAQPAPPAPELTQPVREDLAGELEHASANVDEFDAKLVADAGGVPAPEGTEAPDGVMHPEGLSETEFEELEDRIDEVEEAYETGDEDEIDHAEQELDEEVAESKRSAAAAPAPTMVPTKKGRGRFVAFLRASWAELQRVQWPDRREVGQATAVVLGFVIIAGAYLGVADVVAQKIVDLII